MNQCPKCNNNIPDGAAVCPSCGAELATVPGVWPPTTGIGTPPPPGKAVKDPVQARLSNIYFIIAFLMDVGGYWLFLSHRATWVGIAIIYLALIPWVLCCVAYARCKHYSPWLGVLGLLSCIGAAILIALPIRRPTVP